MTELKNIVKEIEFKQNFIGEGFLRPPDNKMSRINLFGEISHLEGFIADKLYVFYEFDLPEVGWKIDNENEYYEIYKKENVLEENINKLKSVTQKSTCVANDKGDYICNLSFPFELELLCHEAVLDKSWPKILIQVNSVDSWERHRIEGYGFINVPNFSGYSEIKIPCYKPREDLSMNIFSQFLGGSRRIPDIKDIAKTCTINENELPVALNKYGIKSEFSGFLSVNLNVSKQIKSVSEYNRKMIKEKQGKISYSISSAVESKGEVEEHYMQEKPKYMENVNTKNFGLIGRFNS
jgi:Meckel syndrome type 1 protein